MASSEGLRFDRLVVRNFRALGEVDVAFPDGLVGIVGGNGSGKSSLLWAIVGTLYGVDPLPYKKLSLIGPLDDEAFLSFSFTLAGTTYTVERTIRRRDGATTAVLRSPAGELARGTDAVSAEVRRLVGNPTEWITSRLVAQKQLNALSVLEPAARKRLILQLLGIEAVEGAIKGLRERVTEIDRTTKSRRAVLPDADSLTATIAENERELARTRAESAAVTAGALERAERSARAATELAAVTEAAKRAAVTRAEHDLIEKSLAADAAEIELLEERLADAAGLDERHGELDASVAEITAEGPELERLDRLSKYATAAASLRLRIVELEGADAEARATLERLSSTAAAEPAARLRLSAAGTARDAAESAARLAEAKRAELRVGLLGARDRVAAALRHRDEIDGAGTCPTCGQGLADPVAARARAQEEVDAAEAEVARITADGLAAKAESEAATAAIEAARSEREGAEAALAAAQSATAELSGARVRAAALAEDLAAARDELAEAEAEPYDASAHEALRVRASELPERIALRAKLAAAIEEAASRRSDLARLTAKLTESEAERDRLRATLAAAGADPNAEAAAREHAEAATRAETDAAVRTSTLAGEESRLEALLARDRERLADHRALVAEIDELVAERVRIDATRLLLESFKVTLIGRIRPALERRASALLRELSDGRYDTLVLDEDYEASIGAGAGVRSVREVSGGEEDLANLCLRVAIGQLISESTGVGAAPIILDEVLGSQDGDRRDRIMELLPRLAVHFPQVLMVAHLPEVHDRFETSLALEWDPVSATSRLVYPESPTDPDDPQIESAAGSPARRRAERPRPPAAEPMADGAPPAARSRARARTRAEPAGIA